MLPYKESLVQSLIDNEATMQAAMEIMNTQMASISPLGPYTVATLPTPSVSNLGRTAIVTDLFGTTYDCVRCCKTGTFYFWKPISSDSAATIAMTGNMSIGCLTAPQSIKLTGTIGLGVTRNFTLDTAGGWPGAQKEINAGLSSLLGVLNILGTGLGSGVSVLLGGYKKFVLDYSSGSLQWIQIV